MSRHRDLLVLIAILVLAAVVRLPGLDGRGQWDADQGNEMLTLLHLAGDGQVPLVGPPTFLGTFHHGALYYYLLAPAALLGDADPFLVTLAITLLGIVTVAVVWALGRELGGTWAGHVAGLLAAVSPALVLGSTFIWNPNLVPLGAGLGLLGAVRAWRLREPRWWLLAAAGTMVAMQLHVSGGILLPPLAVAFLLDVRRSGGRARGSWLRTGFGAALILAAGYLPLLVHELTTDFADLRGLIGHLGGGGTGAGDLGVRLLVVALRSLAWPFVGVVTEAPMLAAAVTLGVIASGVAAVRLVAADRRPGAWLLIAVLAWSLPVLAVAAPTLLTSVAGLPNDHYHTFLDPLVIGLVGTGIAALARGATKPAMAAMAAPADAASRPPMAASLARGLGAAALAGLVAVSVVRWPPAVSPDGGWALADAAAGRVEAALGSLTTRPSLHTGLAGIPEFKSADALGFPLARRGVATWAAATPEAAVVDRLVIVCDPLFEDVVGLACGGPAEGDWLGSQARPWRLVDRFGAGPRRVVSVYAIGDEQ